LEVLQAIRTTEPNANVLVYTEYVDSQTAVLEVLNGALKTGALTGEVLSIQGDDPEAVRTRATDRFCSADGLILVSTDGHR